LKRIGVLTSGGDAPGMNAAIRSVVRGGLAEKWEVVGIRRGYAGLIAGEGRLLDSRDVGEVMQRGGTILGSSRSEEFRVAEGREAAVRQIEGLRLDGLVIIGGNGTQTGAYALAQAGIPVVGIASTVDNDLAGFDTTLGVDTALNIALEAIDRLKTTASSHGRAFLVEVMGRDHGYLAMMAGLAGGAEAIVLPELDTGPEALAAAIAAAYERGKPHAIVVLAEGARLDGEALEQFFNANHRELGFEVRLTKLGHVQRGGIPTAADRLLGLRSGLEAISRLLAGERNIVVGLRGSEVVALPMNEVVATKKQLDTSLLSVATVLAQ
jgi:6-phosphofructokinase 1